MRASLTLLGAIFCATSARAAPIEAWQGVELGGSRMLAMGGAFLAVAEGAQAGLDNPAALAVRPPRAADTWTSVGLTVGAAGLNTLSGFAPDEVNAEEPERRLRLGVVWRRGPAALGAFGSSLGYAFDRTPDTPSFRRMEHGALSLGGGYALGGGSFVVGALGHLMVAGVTAGTHGLFGREVERVAVGPGATVGALWAPSSAPWRLGLRYRPYARTLPPSDAPAEVDVRWPVEVGVGLAWQIGVSRNAPATYGRGPALVRDGRYLLLTSDVDVLGPSGGVPWTEWIGPARAAAVTTVALHVGAEAEVAPQRLTARLGAYTQPGRGAGVPNRLHGTAGCAVLVGRFPWIGGLRVSPAVDLSQDGFRLSLGIGPW